MVPKVFEPLKFYCSSFCFSGRLIRSPVGATLRIVYTHKLVKSYAVHRKVLIVVVVVLLFYVHGKHLRSCRDGQLT